MRIGAPTEFGNNILIPLLSKFSVNHPELEFQIQTSFSTDFTSKLADGSLDLAIVDEFVSHPFIERTEVFEEKLDLCLHKSLWKGGREKKEQLRKTCMNLPFVDYDKDASLVSRWFKHHFGKGVSALQLRATAPQDQSVAEIRGRSHPHGVRRFKQFVVDELRRI